MATWWYSWNSSGTTATTCVEWECWNTSGTTATSNVSGVWLKWNSNKATATNSATCWEGWVYQCGGSGGASVATFTKPTAEEIEARKRREESEAAERKKREAEQKAADEKAAALLRDNLTKEQADALDKHKTFAVIGSDGERYEIDVTKRQHNVFLTDEQGNRVREFCIHNGYKTPMADSHLAQKLLLEADAEHFKRVANKWDLVPARKAVRAG